MHPISKEILTIVRDLIDAFLRDDITGPELLEALEEIQNSIAHSKKSGLHQKAKVIPLFAPP
jgi:hypothetical protein